MATDKGRKDFDKPNVDEDYLMNIIGGDELVPPAGNTQQQEISREAKSREKAKKKKKN